MQLATMLANTSFIAAVPQLVAQHHSRTLNETIPVLDGSLTRFAARKTPLYEQQKVRFRGRVVAAGVVPMVCLAGTNKVTH